MALSVRQAADKTRADQVRAAHRVLAVELHTGLNDLEVLAGKILDAAFAIPVTHADQCDDVHSDYGQCERTYGHDAWVLRTKHIQFTEIYNEGGEIIDRIQPHQETYQDRRHKGHWTYDYEDPRRPDGSHPWDF